MLLEIKNLSVHVEKDFKTKVICNNLNFSIKEGETLGILGESGSGKSITALSILRLLPPSLKIFEGNIYYRTKKNTLEDLASVPVDKLRSIRGKEISMIFQEPMSSLNPVFTCGNQVLETLLQHYSISGREAYERTISLFQKVKLPDPVKIFEKYPFQLSGGQRQRVMIAIAIACNPRLLIADEPTTALDVTVQKSILELLKELQNETGMSILFISHDINVISVVADSVAVFYKGELLEWGDVSQVLNKPINNYTQGLLSCRHSILTKGIRLKTLDEFIQNSHTEDISRQSEFEFTQAPKLNSKTVIFNVKNLDVFFTKRQILKNIELKVFEGETLGLVGESGSGKTTLGRAIMKLIKYEADTIEFHGQSLKKLSDKELIEFRKKVQIIFQDPYSSLNPKITVGEMILEPLMVHKIYKTSKERKLRVMELLTQVNLKEEHYYRYPHQFSGGQRQRIGIARALAVEPELIILDESVSALDASVQAQILNLLNNIKKLYNLTYIFISHDLQVVRYMADRIIVLKDGEILEEGETEMIYQSPVNAYTARLIASVPKLELKK